MTTVQDSGRCPPADSGGLERAQILLSSRAPPMLARMSSQDGDRGSLEARVAALEREVRQLRAEVMRSEAWAEDVGSADAARPVVEGQFVPPPRPPEAAARPQPVPPVARAKPLIDLET